MKRTEWKVRNKISGILLARIQDKYEWEGHIGEAMVVAKKNDRRENFY